MSRDRTRTRERSGSPSTGNDVGTSEFEVGIEEELDREEPTADASSGSDGRLRNRVGSRAKRLFSPRAFVAALLLTVGGLLAANTFVPLPGSGLLGVFFATFLFGLVLEESRYAEAAAAGGLAVAASTFLDFALVAFLGGFGVSLAVLGGVVGAAVGTVGNYFGRDLRDGLTRDI